MGMIISMFSILPTIDIQAALEFIMLCASGSFTVDADVEGFATLLIFFSGSEIYISSVSTYSLIFLIKAASIVRNIRHGLIQHHIYQIEAAMDMLCHIIIARRNQVTLDQRKADQRSQSHPDRQHIG